MLISGLTQADAQELHFLRDATDSIVPNIGVHVGGGRHVDMPSTWDGTGLVPPGWTGEHGAHEEFEWVTQVIQIPDPDDPMNPIDVEIQVYQSKGTWAVYFPARTLHAADDGFVSPEGITIVLDTHGVIEVPEAP